MMIALHIKEEPESINGNIATNINHQLIQHLGQIPDCLKEEGLHRDVVVGVCVASEMTGWMRAWRIWSKYCSVDHQRWACLLSAQVWVVSTNPNLAEMRRGMFVQRFCSWHFLFAFSSVQTSVWSSAFLLLCARSSGAWLDSCIRQQST